MLPFGLDAIDNALPGRGLSPVTLHEVAGGASGALHGAAAILFTAGIAARTTGQVLWCLTRPDLFAPALAQAGLDPDRVIIVEAGDEQTALACCEEGLRHGGLGSVVGEIAKLSMTASRRLKLAAESSGTMALVIRRWKNPRDTFDFGQPTAAATRWRVTALPSSPLPVPGIGRPRWLVELIRAQSGSCADFVVEACDEEGCLALPADMADPKEDHAALERLGLWVIRRYSPHVAVDPPDGLVLDATGSAQLFGGEDAMLADLVQKLAASNIAAKAAMAASWGAAHAFARHYKHRTLSIAADATADTLARLPIQALRLSVNTVEQLQRMGFARIAELNATARAPLVLRFGHDVTRRLDQAYGRQAEPFIPLEPPELPRVTRAFVEPIAAPETLHRYTEKLTVELAGFLELHVLGARQLDLLFIRVDARTEGIRVGFGKPTRDPKRMTRLLAGRIETLDPGLGVERMTLIASRTDPLPWRDGSTLGDAPEKDISELVDTLTNRVGEDRLYRLAAVESDIPERSVTRIPPLAEPTDLRWPIDWARPARLLPHPEPIETTALLPDHPPVQFTWRGERRRIKRADGPERIFGEWIRSAAESFSVRDYFAVEDEAGERFWIFRAGDGEDTRTGDQRWFLHGVFG